MSANATAPAHGAATAGATPEAKPEGGFEPVIIGFTCNWCSYRAADMAGTARMKYPPNIRLIRLMCSGRLDPTFVLKAFASGADGVMVSGCHPGDCHYVDQNYKALRRYHLLVRTLEQLGIERERLNLTWASAGEGAIFADAIASFTEQVRSLGPLDWPSDGPDEVPDVAQSAADPAGAGKLAAEVTA
jgi:F420-non-reducing hydrogenase iron-sulfur subunit